MGLRESPFERAAASASGNVNMAKPQLSILRDLVRHLRDGSNLDGLLTEHPGIHALRDQLASGRYRVFFGVIFTIFDAIPAV